MPSTTILPACGSTMRKSDSASVDFPLPVAPHTPTFSPGRTENETSWSTSGNSGAYRAVRPSTSSAPAVGQPAGGRTAVSSGAPGGTADSPSMRSTETIVSSSDV